MANLHPHARSLGLKERLRFGDWWPRLVPVVASCFYATLLLGADLRTMGRQLPWFLLALVSIAAFGYTLNDCWDADSDSRAGRANAQRGLSRLSRLLLVGGPLVVGLGAWAALDPNRLASLFFVLQLLLLVVYSVPPFRFKERGSLGVVADALYGHVVPLAIVLSVFPPNVGSDSRGLWAGALGIWTLAKGLRNILLHQVEDRKRDRLSGVATYGSRRPPLETLSLINRLLLPLEFMALGALLVGLDPAWMALIIFLGYTTLKFSAWKLWTLPRRYLRLKFLWFLNDFYEEWLGLTLLLILVQGDRRWLVVALVHLMLFPGILRRLPADLRTMSRNLTEVWG